MKKKLLNHFLPPQEKIKPLLIMKLTVSLIVLTVFQANAAIFPQAVKVNVDVRNGTLENVIGQIREQSDYMFVYEVADIKSIGAVSIKMNDADIQEVLASCLRGSDISFVLRDNTIVLMKSHQEAQQPQERRIAVKGVVRDEQGNPLNGVSVMLKSNSAVGVRTDRTGAFEITVSPGDKLRFTYVGMKEQEVEITSATTNINVKMTIAAKQLEEVAVISTGLFTREKATFTGNVASFSGEELRQVSSRSVLSSLAVLDPSFRILDNIDAGSDPNVLPSVQFRGGGAVSLYAVKDEFSQDPNLPLFVLNGVEVPFTRIYDLDPDRIESIHLLKDAGSTAIYGSRGANGVMVVETIKPKVGEYQIYYNGTFEVDAPDLSVYNMMNAAEKLEFEYRSGKFTSVNYPYTVEGASTLLEYRKLYNEIQKRIVKGVDTYWLSEPVRAGFSNIHSIRIGGGSEELSLDVSAKLGNINGVMKNSSRDTWAGASQIQYRAGKFIVSNDTDVSGYNATHSNYGSFATWVNTSPYYEKSDSQFLLESYTVKMTSSTGLETSSIIQNKNVVNPLWNANLNSRNESEQLDIANNFMIQYRPDNKFMMQGNFMVRRTQEQSTVFKDPEHTDFYGKSYLEKGSFTGKEARSTFFQGQFRANYATSIDGFHNFSTILNTYINQIYQTSMTTEAEGFFYGSMGLPSNAHTYKPNSKPGYSPGKRRQVGMTLTGHYNYLERYLLDATYQIDGATTFGANNIYKTFWSVGLGWNIERENFAQTWDWLDELRLRGSIGIVGNQSLGQIYSKTVYRSMLDTNVYGQGTYISNIGTPDLPWSIVRKTEVNLELRAWKGRLSMKAGYYDHKTDPLILNVFMKPSTGENTYPMDIGRSTERGVELNLVYNPIYRLEDRIFWSIRVNGIHYTKKYGGFGDKLNALNEMMRESVDFVQYRDGYSEEDLWAVRSYGIDPATGREVYVKKDGSHTFIYDARDRVRIGSTTPDLEGTIHTLFNYKNLSFSAALSYSIGGHIYNGALYDKVENISREDLDKNQDKRALYSRWTSVGDISQFRSIALVSSDNPKTSRFIQRNDYLRGYSFNIAYEYAHSEWLKNNLGIRRTQLSLGMDELFRLETSKREIGIDYPYARKFTLKLSLSF